MININLFGGPGIGKSTTASGLFYFMKTLDYHVEYIQEFAKELTFSKDFTRLGDQLLVLGEQHHRLKRLQGQVDYIIHDSPFIMGLCYIQNDIYIPIQEYKDLVLAMFSKYNNINIFLERDIKKHIYQEYGRTQTLEQAIEKDNEIKQMLDNNNIKYITISVKDASNKILSIIKENNEIQRLPN